MLFPMGKYHYRALTIATLLAAAALAGLQLSAGHNWGDDFAIYLLQAESLVRGTLAHFNEQTRITVTYSSTPMGNGPWGFPFLLAPVVAAFGRNLMLLKVPGVLCFLGFLAVFHAYARRYLSPFFAWLGLALFAFNPTLLGFLDQLLSDVPFLFVSTAALALASRERSGALPLTLGFTAAMLLRSSGALLPLSYAVASVSRDPRNPATWKRAILPGALAALAYLAITFPLPSAEGTYLAISGGLDLAGFAARLVSYLFLFGYFFGFSGLPSLGFSAASSPGSWAVTLLAMYGLGKGRDTHRVALGYLFFSLLLLAAFPFWGGIRYLFPLLPILMVGLLSGLELCLRRIASPRLPKIFAPAAVATVLYFFAQSTADLAQKRAAPEDPGGPYGAASQDLYAFLRSRVPPGDIVAFFKPRALRLQTGLNAINAGDCEHLAHARWLVIHRRETDPQQISPETAQRCRRRFDQILRNETYIVFALGDLP